MNEQPEVNPSVPADFRGAIDLASPAQQAITKFKETMLKAGGTTLLCVGLTENGQAVIVQLGKKIEVLGLSALAQHMLLAVKEQPDDAN